MNEQGREYDGVLAGKCRHCGNVVPEKRIECPECGGQRQFSPEEYRRLLQWAARGVAHRWQPATPRAEGPPGDPTDPSVIVPISPNDGGLSAARLEGADLAGADLRHTDLSGAFLDGADLSGARLEGAILSWASMEAADLTGANLRGAALNLASLKGADLSDVCLVDADLEDAELE